LLKRIKTEPSPTVPLSRRLLVVDDHSDAGHLIGQLLRRANYEVAEIGDHHGAVSTLVALDEPVAGVLACFSTAGTGACLRLLDTLRNHHDPRLHDLRVLLISDQSRQQIFCLQAGADGILLRPFTDVELVDAVEEMVKRPEAERMDYRRAMVERIKADASMLPDPMAPMQAPTGTSDWF